MFDKEILPHSNLTLHFSSQFNQGQPSSKEIVKTLVIRYKTVTVLLCKKSLAYDYYLYSEMEPFQNIILLKCYTFLLLLVILNETPAHVIQMKGLQLQVMQFSISLKGEKRSSYQIEFQKYCFSFVTLDCY